MSTATAAADPSEVEAATAMAMAVPSATAASMTSSGHEALVLTFCISVATVITITLPANWSRTGRELVRSAERFWMRKDTHWCGSCRDRGRRRERGRRRQLLSGFVCCKFRLITCYGRWCRAARLF